MAWLNLNDAITKIVNYKGDKGCHVFYEYRMDSFEVQIERKNSKGMKDKIELSPHKYRGFYNQYADLNYVMEDLIHARQSQRERGSSIVGSMGGE